jgi:hypothetical protein
VSYHTERLGEHALACADVILHWKEGEQVHRYGPLRGCDTLYTPPPAVDIAALEDRVRDSLTRSDGGFNAKGFDNAMKAVRRATAPHIDNDAFKKATTDALTKLLSHLGFNADVFLGLFDDNKYVKRMEQEFDPNYQDAQRYLGPVRQFIKDNDSMGAAQLVSEMRSEADDDALVKGVWSMLNTVEREWLGNAMRQHQENE